VFTSTEEICYFRQENICKRTELADSIFLSSLLLEQPQTEWALGMKEGKLQDSFNVVLWLANPQILL